MESYILPKKFVNIFYKEIFKFLTKNFRKIGTKHKYTFWVNVEQIFKQTIKSQNEGFWCNSLRNKHTVRDNNIIARE